jgi:hypothetical protein
MMERDMTLEELVLEDIFDFYSERGEYSPYLLYHWSHSGFPRRMIQDYWKAKGIS